MTKLTQDLEEFLSRAQGEIERALRRTIASDETPIRNLDDALEYSLGLDPEAPNQGKRIRPVLCLMVSHCLCGETEPALPFAVGIELMHNFALVHDDIEDGDEFRRGRPAVWKRYGLPHAINVGDYLFTKIFKALSEKCDQVSPEVQLELFKLMGQTLDHTHRGQALDMNAREEMTSKADYIRLVTEKTGYYLAAPLVAGAIAAGADYSIKEGLRKYGLRIGPMFQIRDDVIDLTHGKGRDTVGSDIKEGKRSFLVAHVLENATEEEKTELLHILDLSREDTTPEMVARAMAIFKQTGALAQANTTCDRLKNEALAYLNSMPVKLRSWLVQMTEALVARTA